MTNKMYQTLPLPKRSFSPKKESKVTDTEEKAEKTTEDEKKEDDVKEEGAEDAKAPETAEGETKGEDGEGKEKEDGEDSELPSKVESEEPYVVEEVKKPNYDGAPLADHISEEHLSALHIKFLNAPKRRMSAELLRATLDSVVGLVFEDYDFQLLFLKMKSRRDPWVLWDDLISHLTIEYQEKYEDTVQVNLDMPIQGEPRIIKSHHRHPVVRLIFCPALGPDRELDYKRGCYASVSNEGIINFWNLDLELERTVTSKSVFLKVSPTWITDMIALPDFDIICTSSTERDLRFYDTTARQFQLRVVVSSLDSAVVAMHYAWSLDPNKDSHLVTGDMAGGVRVYTITCKQKGPFHHTPGIDTRNFLSEFVVRGDLKGMRVRDFKGVHNDWVRQVYYYSSLSSVLSCSLSAENSLVLRDTQGVSTNNTYHAAQGFTCFGVMEDGHLIATGGPDCLVRLWNVFVTNKAVCVFRGHHACVVTCVIQADTQRVVSLSKDRCIKVWDIAFQNCIQTYTQLPATLGGDFITSHYNPLSHAFAVAGLHFAVVLCGALVSESFTDGMTHTAEVTIVVYNPLFKVLITMGCMSMIMVWNMWKGRRKLLMKMAHTKLWFGINKAVEITAATFDPTYHLLLTGARDGTVKMWNFNTGTCVRNLSIEPDREVTNLIWLHNRILATGWNRHVEEWQDSQRLSASKCWEQRHTSDIMSSAAYAPQCLATGSYAGELVFWRMETGQAYRKHTVDNPTVSAKLDYLAPVPAGSRTALSDSAGLGVAGGKGDGPRIIPGGAMYSKRVSSPSVPGRTYRTQQQTTQAPASARTVSIQCLHFLRSRISHPSVGTLLVSLENGYIQVWSHHSAGGFITAFFAPHTRGDYVVSMTTDPEDEYLFTGTTAGYLKIWLLTNYFSDTEVRLVMPLLRLQFPFMWADRFEGRAKRRCRKQPLPMLLSSYRGHLRAVNSMVYIAQAKVLVTASNDNTVRVWTLGGRYIGTLGPARAWEPIDPETGPKDDHPFRLPPDIKRVGSYTTLRVLKGGRKWWEVITSATLKALEKARNEFPAVVLDKCIYGEPLTSPRLGNWFKMPDRPEPPPTRPRIDVTAARIPVFCHLSLSPEVPVTRPTTPPGVKERRQQIHADPSGSVY